MAKTVLDSHLQAELSEWMSFEVLTNTLNVREPLSCVQASAAEYLLTVGTNLMTSNTNEVLPSDIHR